MQPAVATSAAAEPSRWLSRARVLALLPFLIAAVALGPPAPGHRLGQRPLLPPRRTLDLSPCGPHVPHTHRRSGLGGRREPRLSARHARHPGHPHVLRQGRESAEPSLVPPGDHHHLHPRRRPRAPLGAVHGPGAPAGLSLGRAHDRSHRRYRLRPDALLPRASLVRACRGTAGVDTRRAHGHQHPARPTSTGRSRSSSCWRWARSGGC